MNFIKNYVKKKQDIINSVNRNKLTNKTPSLICSNCLGGYIYHWLGLQFSSPFINLWMTNEDFVSMLEFGIEDFLKQPLVEVVTEDSKYPVGEINGVKIRFQHYSSFDEAKDCWNRRIDRFDYKNMLILFSNFEGDERLLKRFDELKYKNKIVFVDTPYKYESSFYIKGYLIYKNILKCIKSKKVPNLFHIKNYFTGKRFIDQFDYVSFINGIKEEK